MRREKCEYGSRCRFRHINKEENIDRRRYNERKTNEYNHRNHHYNEHHNVNRQRNVNWNWNTNQQWEHSARHNNYNPYNQMQGQQKDFYMNQDQNWRAMSKPIIERAAEILAEKLWDNQ